VRRVGFYATDLAAAWISVCVFGLNLLNYVDQLLEGVPLVVVVFPIPTRGMLHFTELTVPALYAVNRQVKVPAMRLVLCGSAAICRTAARVHSFQIDIEHVFHR
jgi:hypothetical protein